MKYLALLFISILFLSCSDAIVNPLPFEESTKGVKSKVYYPSIESPQVLNIEDFEYRNRQLQKIIYYSENRTMIYHYELFNYDNSRKLRYKLDYWNNINSPTGFNLLDSTVYFYSGNLLTTEEIIYPYYKNSKYVYEYRGSTLIKKLTYSGEELESYTIFLYKNNKLNKEITHYKDDSILGFKEYKYTGTALVEVVFYNKRNEAMRRIRYDYNKNGKLVLEKADELVMYSSSLPYVVKYKY